MNDWTEGYVADIGYTYGYYAELNPAKARLALLSAGWAAPDFSTACELGFGQGLSINVHAAATSTRWYGTDFNPAQAGFARALARDSATEVGLHDDSFEEFAARADLPEFDFIGLHGIWSWISDENRRTLVDFIRRKLRVGGVVYVSYNTQPGWAAFAPMRHLLAQHAATLGAPGQGRVQRIDAALDFAHRLMGQKPLFGKANPQVAERLKKLKDQDRHYLAHEYFNADWHPMHFSDMAKWLAPAKLGFAASAHLLDHVEPLNLNATQAELLRDLPDPLFREGVRDFIVNQQFRRDLWVRGPRRLDPLERMQALRDIRLVLVSPVEDVPEKVQAIQGEAQLSPAVREPLLKLMQDHQARTLGQIEEAVASSGVAFSNLLEMVLILAGSSHLAVVQDENISAQSRPAVGRLNRALARRARTGSQIGVLASTMTGGGVAVGRFAQLFMQAAVSGPADVSSLAQYVWTLLQGQGQRIMVKGQALATEQENLEELHRQAEQFLTRQWPLYRALGVDMQA
jgi:SAM-dependent methyltransferase